MRKKEGHLGQPKGVQEIVQKFRLDKQIKRTE